jgi:cell division protein YceG involved in septum cleavage
MPSLGVNVAVIDQGKILGNGLAWRQDEQWKLEQGLSRQEIYSLRDRSGLSRADFFFRNYGDYDPARDHLEVGGYAR